MHTFLAFHRRAVQQVLGGVFFSLAVGAGISAQAQPAKAIVAEPVAALPAFSQWLNARTLVPEPAPVTQVVTIGAAPATAPAPVARFEPLPVILGAPDLPLIGPDAQQTAHSWARALNYQGMHVRLLLLDEQGRRVQSRPLSSPPLPGERFKLRVTATFDAVAEIGLVTGAAWAAQRAGQIYPAPGLSVLMQAGETVDLPMEPERYFVLGNTGQERLLLSVRDPQASAGTRSQQPAYRQDARVGSSYLQLTPEGTRPAFEQLIAAAPR